MGILKRRKRQAENRANRAKEAIKLKVARKHKRATIFKRAEKYAKEYQDQERDEIRLRREARKEGNYYVPADPKLAFVMRIRGKWSEYIWPLCNASFELSRWFIT